MECHARYLCKLFANFLCISYLFQIEPCDDFYNFMCGGFIERTILPAGEGQTSYFHQGRLEVRNEIRSAIRRSKIL